MKLFSPAESKSLNDSQNLRDKLRTQSIRTELQKGQESLAKQQQEFFVMMAGQKERWAKEEQDHSQRVDEMTKEIARLEKAREQALIPIDLDEKRAHTLLNEAESRLSEVIKKEKENEEYSESLVQRNDYISDKEEELLKREEAITLKESGIVSQQKALSENTKNLSESIDKYNMYVIEQNTILSTKSIELEKRERSLVARQSLLDTKEQTLLNKERRLFSERQVLDQAFKELKNGKRSS